MTLSTLSMFDDYTRKVSHLLQTDCAKEFLIFVRNQKQCRLQWKEAVDECHRLKVDLDRAVAQNSELESKLTRARMILHQEQERAIAAEEERDLLQEQVQTILNNIYRGNELANDTREKLERLLNNSSKLRQSCGERLYPNLGTIDEVNSTGDLLSDISMSRVDDTLDTSDRMSRPKKPRKSDNAVDDVPAKRRRSARLSACGVKGNGRELVSTTTVTVPAKGEITAQHRFETRTVTVPKIIEPPKQFVAPSAPPIPSSSSTSSLDSEAPPTPRVDHFSRGHDFTIKTVLKPSEECCVCSKAMGFASKVARCAECKASTHVECREALPVPCITHVATPRVERALRLEEQVGQSPPYVPAILVRCALEVERRGLCELGIYRVPGAEKDVRGLRAKFQRGKGACSLTAYDIHVVCGVLKDFLRSLPEPVITYAQWHGFIGAVRESGHDRNATLYQEVAELPPPNRDTLSFIMLHLLKVAQSPPCKMTISNLATVFGPTLVGYSTEKPTNSELCNQTPLQAMVVESLLDLGEEYWRNVLQKQPATPLLTPKYSFRRRNMNLGKSGKLFTTPPAK